MADTAAQLQSLIHPCGDLPLLSLLQAQPLLEVLPHPVLVIDARGQVGWRNAAARECYGTRVCRCHELVHGVCSSCPRTGSCPKKVAEATGRPASDVHAHRVAEGHTFFHVTALPLAEGGVLEVHVPLDDCLARDTLTGAYTRSFFEQLATRELALLERLQAPFGVIVLDVDGLKPINDTQGHEAGDRVLEAVGQALAASVRSADVVGRIGGDEFCIFLPTAEGEAAWVVARRIQHALRQTRFAAPLESVVIRASQGIALSRDAYALRAAIAHADRALYQAKHQGGDRIVAA